MGTDHLTDDSSVARAIASSRPEAEPYPVAPQFTTRNSQFPRLSQHGFTLIELLVVISLISILAAMAVVQYRNSIQRTQEAVLKSNLVRMRDAIDQYYADKGKYPASLDALVSEQYLRRIPDDPFTKTSDSWQTVPAEPDPGNPSAEPGIYDVKSGAQGQALDGTNFADW
jgi:prepilin-type N-terminal cleavage/methylation domain-containing protein